MVLSSCLLQPRCLALAPTATRGFNRLSLRFIKLPVYNVYITVLWASWRQWKTIWFCCWLHFDWASHHDQRKEVWARLIGLKFTAELLVQTQRHLAHLNIESKKLNSSQICFLCRTTHWETTCIDVAEGLMFLQLHAWIPPASIMNCECLPCGFALWKHEQLLNGRDKRKHGSGILMLCQVHKNLTFQMELQMSFLIHSSQNHHKVSSSLHKKTSCCRLAVHAPADLHKKLEAWLSQEFLQSQRYVSKAPECPKAS